MKRYIAATEELTDEQMEAELSEHFKEVDAKLDAFMQGRINKMRRFELEGFNYIERHSVNDMINSYIRWFNEGVRDYKDGFYQWDPDDYMSILYNDGRIIHVDVNGWDGDKKIKTDGINSIIVDGGWGTAVAGPSIELYNYREVVPYGKWGYKDVKSRYYDSDDIRADFTGGN